jgi:hypothetical protein
MASLGRATMIACAGLVVGPGLWAVNMQAGLILPYADCAGHRFVSAAVSLLLAVLVLGSAVASWRARTDGPAAWASGRLYRFVAMLGGLVALVFAFALVLQVAAGVVLTGCER